MRELLRVCREGMETRHYSSKTIEAYTRWVVRYVEFLGRKSPVEFGEAEVAGFLSRLALEQKVSSSTQNQALAALLYLYEEVLGAPLEMIDGIVHAKRPKRLPVVLTQSEVSALLHQLEGRWNLMASLLYGGGLRLMECVCLRVKDLDLETGQVFVRRGKGGKDRVTLLPQSTLHDLRQHLHRIEAQHRADLAAGAGYVQLPHALAAKYPNAPREWAWQWVFPATRHHVDERTGQRRRHHIHETALQRAVHAAARRADLTKLVSCHTLRHSFATRASPPKQRDSRVLRQPASSRPGTRALLHESTEQTVGELLRADAPGAGQHAPSDLCHWPSCPRRTSAPYIPGAFGSCRVGGVGLWVTLALPASRQR